MTIAHKPEHFQRYRQIVRLLYKHGRREVLRKAGFQDSLRAKERQKSRDPASHPF